MKTIIVTHCNPKNHREIWTGKGRRPKWLIALGWQQQNDAMHVARVIYGRNWLSLEEVEEIRQRVTVTEKQEELPGLPPVPKKRGRPVTGKAMTAAERKRKQRRKAISGWENVSEMSRTALIEQIQAYMASACGKRIALDLLKELQKRIEAMPD